MAEDGGLTVLKNSLEYDIELFKRLTSEKEKAQRELDYINADLDRVANRIKDVELAIDFLADHLAEEYGSEEPVD